MADVSFQEESITHSSTRFASPASKSPGITGWFIARGFVKSEAQANILQIILVILIIGISGYVVSVNGSHSTKITPAQNRELEWMKQGHAGPPPASFMPITAK